MNSEFVLPENVDRAEEELHWLALRLIPGLGTRVALRVVRQVGSATGVFRASPTELESLGIASHVVRNFESPAVFESAVREVEQARQLGVKFITLNDPLYPPLLREIFDPPLLLYVQGDVALLNTPSIGMVGSRKPTAYGRAMAERLSVDLATKGLTIVSGLARGIDTVAHQAALTSNGKTIAVLGCGIDVVYPAENKKLHASVAEKGLLISEFPLGSFPAPQNFPIRNRVISGLSLGVVVVEAAQYSGSLITARLAMEQNREVFGVPGSLTNTNSWGPHTLIKQGAKLVQDWRDVIEELPAEVKEKILLPLLADAATKDADQASLLAESLTVSEKSVYDLLKVDESIHIDDVLSALPKLSPSEVLANLLELEFKNMVRQLPGKNFVKSI